MHNESPDGSLTNQLIGVVCKRSDFSRGMGILIMISPIRSHSRGCAALLLRDKYLSF